MKKLLLLGIVFMTSVIVSGTAFAAGYGAAGCGPGSLVAGSEPGAMQLVGVTTNGTSKSTQTTAITMGTSNCNPQGLVKLEKEREVYAQSNYSSLVKEMAMGQGEHLNTLAGLYGCSEDSYGTFQSMVQKNFEEIILDDHTTSREMLISIEGRMGSDTVLSNSCTGIIG